MIKKRIAIIIQCYIRSEYIKNMILSLKMQIKTHNNYDFKILFWQDSINQINHEKYKSIDIVKLHNKVKEICIASLDEITEYKCNQVNKNPSITGSLAIDYTFDNYKSDYFILIEDDVILSNNFLNFMIYSFENLLTDNNLFVSAYSIFFFTKCSECNNDNINFVKKIINLFNMNTFYYTKDFLPSVSFGSNYYGWSKIKDTKKSIYFDGSTECNNVLKKNNIFTIMPIVPHLLHKGYDDEYSFSLLHVNNMQMLKENNNIILQESDNINTFRPFIYNMDYLYNISCNLKIKYLNNVILYICCHKIKNIGDFLSLYIFYYFGINIEFTSNIEKSNLLFIGSNLDNIVKHENIKYVFSAGFMYSNQYTINNEQIKMPCIRGKKSLKKIKFNKDIFLSDGALLLNKIFDFGIIDNLKKKTKYKLGIIPHINDLKQTQIIFNEKKNKNIKIIDATNNLSDFVFDCLDCEFICSSSLHGLVIADVLKIPNYIINLSFSKRHKEDYYYKYNDYYSIYDIEINENEIISEENSIDCIINYINKMYVNKNIAEKSEYLHKIFLNFIDELQKL
jgi:pyruvyltransferase